MRKFFVISLSLLIVILSFVFCFADNASPVILPIGDGVTSGGYSVYFPSQNLYRYYNSNNSPVYLVFYNNGSNIRALTFSETSGSRVYFSIGDDPEIYTWRLNTEYDGFYYDSSVTSPPDNSYIMSGVFASPTDVIDEVNNSVFSSTFNLTYIVDASVTWLSTFAQAVKNNALLLFFVVFIFVGIGIGLLNRFRRG